jgi:ribosomal protein S18 acetylase RimI-like enzyme
MSAQQLRAASAADIPSLERIFVASVAAGWSHIFGRELLSGLTQPDLPEWDLPGTSVVAAERDGVLVGFASFGPPYGESGGDETLGKVYRLFVSPADWRGGVGSALLQRACDALTASGFHAAVLWVAERNEVARGWYDRRGWTPDGRRRTDSLLGVEYTSIRYRRELQRRSPPRYESKRS